MSRDILILLVMIMLVMGFSAYGEAEKNHHLEEIEFELEDSRLDFTSEIEKQEGQFRVVINSLKREEAGNEEAVESENDPLTVSLIKVR